MYFSRTPPLARKLFKDLVWSICTEEKAVYLTFDDGPTPEVTEWTLDILKKFNASATFFCLGKNIEEHPHLFQKIIADNHSVGNHTFNHFNGWKISSEEYLGNVHKCQDLISKYQSTENKKNLFRPPYGRILKSHIRHLQPLYSIIMWDVMSGDFDKKTSAEQCIKNVVDNVQKGSIILFHDSEKASKNLFYALPKTLEILQEKGFCFRSL